MSVVKDKIQKLQNILLSHKRVAVAFSGGIDSTFLLYFAIETLKAGNVLALSCTSAVNSARGLDNMRSVYNMHFDGKAVLREVEISPLTWKEFVPNCEKRCYYCKKRMYTILLGEATKEGFPTLLDGTNVDDLKGDRPGLKAIRELNIQTPLVEAGLTKLEIRAIAKDVGLVNHDLPSNSCLATRIAVNSAITVDTLELIETAEEYLRKRGFLGCRVKVNGDSATIELISSDFDEFIKEDSRTEVIHTFYNLGFKSVCLSLTGR